MAGHVFGILKFLDMEGGFWYRARYEPGRRVAGSIRRPQSSDPGVHPS